MTELRDSIYYQQLARKARQLAAGHANPVVARRLREEAVKHDRLARQLKRSEARLASSQPGRRGLFSLLSGRDNGRT